ncbi:MAG: RNA 2'-phosphotransferase [Eubacterium sp.]
MSKKNAGKNNTRDGHSVAAGKSKAESDLEWTAEKVKFVSKKMSVALRHKPDRYGITLDEEGWTDLPDFIRALNRVHHFSPRLTEKDIRYVSKHTNKRRFELTDQKIRARYGHSVPVILKKEKKSPPEILYHGTSHQALKSIMENGLLPMKRQYVHLSSDQGAAIQVGRRHDAHPALLQINASEAEKDGIEFFIGNDEVWLCRELPPEYIKVIS